MYSCTRAYTTKQITKQIRVRRCVPCSVVESRIIGSSKIGVWSRGCAGAPANCSITRRCAERYAEGSIGSLMTRAYDARLGNGSARQRGGFAAARRRERPEAPFLATRNVYAEG